MIASKWREFSTGNFYYGEAKEVTAMKSRRPHCFKIIPIDGELDKDYLEAIDTILTAEVRGMVEMPIWRLIHAVN